MKRMIFRIALLVVISVYLCLSFFVFSAAADDELLAFPSVFYLYSGGSYQQLLDINPANDDVDYTPIYMPSISRFQIRGLQEFRGKIIHYSFLIAPMKYSSPTDNATFTRTLGNIQFSSISGFGNFNASLTAVSLPLNANHLDMVYYQYASILSIEIHQSNNLSSVNGTAYLSSVISPFTCTSGQWDGNVALLGASVFTSDNRILTDTLYFLQNDISPTLIDIKSLLSQRLPFTSGYTYSEVGRDADGNLAVSETSGSWWDATLQTLRNLTFDLDKSVEYQNQIDGASTDSNDNEALGMMLDDLTDANSIGTVTGFGGIFNIAPNDPELLTNQGVSGFLYWFTQQNYDDIQQNEIHGRAPQDLDGWVLPYNDKIYRMIADLEGGEDADESD